MHNALSNKLDAGRVLRSADVGNLFSSWRKEWHVFVVISV